MAFDPTFTRKIDNSQMTHEASPTPSRPPSHDNLLDRLRAATELLEQIAADANLHAPLPLSDRERLHQAVARVHNPDHAARRQKRKAAVRERNAAQTRDSEAALSETGIRALRRKPVFTAPAFFPPLGFSAQDITPSEDSASSADRESTEPQHCYVCKQT